MSQPSQEQLKVEAREVFVNDFWSNITADLKYKILEAKYGVEFIKEEFQEWLSEQEHD